MRQVAREVLTGRYFESKRLANLVDDDFFHWIRSDDAEKVLAPMWERILSHLIEYDLSHVREDVLKGVYQQLIDPKDRYDLGEYYTPDWLCERIVQELLPKHGFKTVLDPSCGSGSFLRAVINHFLDRNPGGTENDRLRLVLSNVQGIDIHPVAVTIARATYVLALGKLVSSARSPVNIPVYLADSLFLPREVEQNLYDKLSGVEITFGGKKNEKQVVIPDMLIQRPDLFDAAISACTKVAEDHAESRRDNQDTLDKYLSVHVPELHTLLEYPDILPALWNFTDSLAELIREKKNSIWSFIIRNSYRPAMLRQQFDFIIGNPPWLSYRYISDPDYQDEIKRRAVNMYKIAPKSQKLFTQMELATVFLAHSMATFAKKPDAQLAFVMPRSVLSADQHQNLITRKYSPEARFQLIGYWDLWDVQPLFNVPSCVLFAKRSTLPGNWKETLPVLEWVGNLPARDVSWKVASARLEHHEEEGRVIYLGSRAALSTAPGARAPSKPSKYQEIFKNGATIYPRNFYFVRVAELNGKPEADRQYWVETDPEQATEAKPPYDDVEMKGMVEGKFIFTTALSRHVLPFVHLTPANIVLPISAKGGTLSILKAQELMKSGFREFGTWMKKAEELWETKRGGKAGKQDVYQWLDYQGKLTAQNVSQRHLVLYNAAGTNVSATYFDRNQYPTFVVEHKLYWAAFSDPREAHYVVAVFNSDSANQAIKPFQSTGLMGERDIHKKLLELPIPLFNPEDPTHRKLAELGACAADSARTALNSEIFPVAGTLARQRAFIRTHLEGPMKEIDELVVKLLGK